MRLQFAWLFAGLCSIAAALLEQPSFSIDPVAILNLTLHLPSGHVTQRADSLSSLASSSVPPSLSSSLSVDAATTALPPIGTGSPMIPVDYAMPIIRVSPLDQIHCPTSNDSFAFTSPQTPYRLGCGMDFYGGDIDIDEQVPQASGIAECLKLCDQVADCVGVSFSAGSDGALGDCYRKSVLTRPVLSLYIVAGLKAPPFRGPYQEVGVDGIAWEPVFTSPTWEVDVTERVHELGSRPTRATRPPRPTWTPSGTWGSKSLQMSSDFSAAPSRTSPVATSTTSSKSLSPLEAMMSAILAITDEEQLASTSSEVSPTSISPSPPSSASRSSRSRMTPRPSRKPVTRVLPGVLATVNGTETFMAVTYTGIPPNLIPVTGGSLSSAGFTSTLSSSSHAFATPSSTTVSMSGLINGTSTTSSVVLTASSGTLVPTGSPIPVGSGSSSGILLPPPMTTFPSSWEPVKGSTSTEPVHRGSASKSGRTTTTTRTKTITKVRPKPSAVNGSTVANTTVVTKARPHFWFPTVAASSTAFRWSNSTTARWLNSTAPTVHSSMAPASTSTPAPAWSTHKSLHSHSAVPIIIGKPYTTTVGTPVFGPPHTTTVVAQGPVETETVRVQVPGPAKIIYQPVTRPCKSCEGGVTVTVERISVAKETVVQTVTADGGLEHGNAPPAPAPVAVPPPALAPAHAHPAPGPVSAPPPANPPAGGPQVHSSKETASQEATPTPTPTTSETVKEPTPTDTSPSITVSESTSTTSLWSSSLTTSSSLLPSLVSNSTSNDTFYWTPTPSESSEPTSVRDWWDEHPGAGGSSELKASSWVVGGVAGLVAVLLF